MTGTGGDEHAVRTVFARQGIRCRELGSPLTGLLCELVVGALLTVAFTLFFAGRDVRIQSLMSAVNASTVCRPPLA